MNFVADESCAGPVIQAFREAGHDVIAIAEVAKGVTDEEVLERAIEAIAFSSLRTGILVNWFTRAGGHQLA